MNKKRVCREPTADTKTEEVTQKRQKQQSKIPLSLCKYREIKRDLFTLSRREYSYVHSVSADFEMGSGIALRFKQNFDRQDELRAQKKQVGDVAVLTWPVAGASGPFTIFYLVTKEGYYHKPTLANMESSLYALKWECERLGITRVAMPKIGCGLDRLKWVNVQQKIRSILTNMDVTVCIRR